MTRSVLGYLWSGLLWSVGPWVCGYLIVLAVAAAKILLTAYSNEHGLHFVLYGHHNLANWIRVLWVLFFTLVIAGGIASALVKRILTL